jgi:hypothetical protein
MLPVILSIVLAAIIYQDFRYRAVSVYWLCGTLALTVIYSVWLNGWAAAFTNGGINLALIVVQIAGVFLYFSLKLKKFTNIINQQLGSGDLLFYGVVAFSFSPVNFILFSLAAYIIILVVFLVLKTFGYRKNIPLAGCLAFFMLIIIILNAGFHIFEPYHDDQVMALLVKY